MALPDRLRIVDVIETTSFGSVAIGRNWTTTSQVKVV